MGVGVDTHPRLVQTADIIADSRSLHSQRSQLVYSEHNSNISYQRRASREILHLSCLSFRLSIGLHFTIMAATSTKLGLQFSQTGPLQSYSKIRTTTSRRQISSAILSPRPRTHSHLVQPSSLAVLATKSAQSTLPPPLFTPSLSRSRNASTTSNPDSRSDVLDWNTFFSLRTSRRRYALTSSILTSAGSTTAAIVAFSEIPDLANTVQSIIPTDPFVSMGVATFGATFFGWLIGPAFGNAVWRLLHRSRLPEFTIKEKAFFERIKKHRVNPSGASTNNPVPDFYGEKVGSVAGYRRWLKDQRAFNRKRGGSYPSKV